MVRVFVEGDFRLGEGLKFLFEQELKGKMPVFDFQGGISETVKKFQSDKKYKKKLLLIDLDADFSKRNEKKRGWSIEKFTDKEVFFMIQKMEAWFLSQPETLDKYFGGEISKKVKDKRAIDIANPDKMLTSLTKSEKKKHGYHKVKDGVQLLKLLNLQKLKTDFEDVKNLIETLSKL